MSQDVSTGNNNIQRQKPEDDSTVQSSSTNVEPNDENSPGDNNNESTNHVEQEDNRQKEDTNSRFLIFIYFVGVKSSVFMLVILV